MRNGQSLVNIDVSVIRSTILAVQVTDGEVIEWVPKSRIIKSRLIGTDEARYILTVPKWLAVENGMI